VKRQRVSVEQLVAIFQAGRGEGGGGVPAGGDHRADLLSMEDEVCGLKDRSAAASEATSGGVRQAEEAGAEQSQGETMPQAVLAKRF